MDGVTQLRNLSKFELDLHRESTSISFEVSKTNNSVCLSQFAQGQFQSRAQKGRFISVWSSTKRGKEKEKHAIWNQENGGPALMRTQNKKKKSEISKYFSESFQQIDGQG